MNDFSPETVEIRSATAEDVPQLLEMVRELAEFERLSDQVVATEEDYHRALFGESPAAEALVAEWEGQPIGYAIFFTTFSTFTGRPGLWLEDLYVRPDNRRRGLGTRLLREVAEMAGERGAGRLEWSVLDWNREAIELYEKLGGEILGDWRIVRVEGEAIGALSLAPDGPGA